MINCLKITRLFMLLIVLHGFTLSAQHTVSKPVIGIAQSMDYDSLLAASGFEYLVESAQKNLSPRNLTDAQFDLKLDTIRKLKIVLYGYNVFLPGDLKLVGPSVNDTAILAYTDVVLKRCQQTGAKIMVFGSGGSRRIPEGFDPQMARRQFVNIARKIAVQAKKYNVTLAVENLNSTETNFMTTLAEAYSVVREINHPSLRLCADIYHMLKENESPAVIEKAGAYIVHCDIAEKAERSAPGTKGDDFTAYLKALKKIGYHNKIIIESRWDNLLTRAEPSYQYLQKQINAAY